MKKLLNIRWTRKRIVLAGLVLWAVYGMIDLNNLIKAPERDPAAFVPYKDSAGNVVRLSEQKTRPFLRVGNVESETSRFYGDAMAHFPTVLDCLQRSEWEKPQPDLTKIDWERIDNEKEIQLCLFRIADSYASPEAMVKWYEVNGFRNIRVSNDDGALQGEKISINASWSNKEKGNLVSPNYVFLLWLNIIVHGSEAAINYYKNESVSNTGFTYTIL